MRVWVIFLLLFFISFVVAATKKDEKKKDASTNTQELPDLADGDEKELPAESEEEDTKKPEKKPVSKGKKEKDNAKSKEDEEDYEVASRIEEVRSKLCESGVDGACTASDEEEGKTKGKKKKIDSNVLRKVCTDDSSNKYCECSASGYLDCSRKKKDRSKLHSANVIPVIKNFTIVTADFSDQDISILEKDKILSGREDEVEELKFSGNMISKIERGVFADFTKLVKLHLDDNELTKITPELFEDLGGLHQLFLKNNKFTNLPNGVFKSLKNLKTLVLDGNDIGETLTKETFAGLSSLTKLSLDNCGVNITLPPNVFDHLINLKDLSLRGNVFSEIPVALKALQDLENLDISKTYISEIHSDSFAKDMNVKNLYINEMPYLYSIQEKAFCGMDSLEILTLKDNKQLAEIHENAFGMATLNEYKVAQLKSLDISNCNLTIISEDLLYFEDVETLTLGGNPWNCTCETAFLLGQRIYDFDYAAPPPKCAYPPQQKDKVFPRVQPSEVCPSLKEKKAIWRGVKGLSALLLLTVAVVGCVVLYNRGFFRNLFVRKNGTPTFPSMTYSNLSNTEDGRSLEADFQPRPEDV